jgi:tRNA-dihydrouridine synthase C
MRLFLAPMEGVVDHTLRELLTHIGGIDICVTEFIRITDHLLPDKVFHRLCPELTQQCTTLSGTPVRIQLLGGNPQPIAENAAKAASIGACAIDLNFGCPAKTVNKSDGGACLLQSPYRLYDIIKATRDAVPEHIPVTAKMRLGFNDREQYLDNAMAAYEAGANELVVHARSKADGYKPPAYWDYIAKINEVVNIPVVANGEIWSVDDYLRCKTMSHCDDFMLGRGLLSCPDLALQIKAQQQNIDYQAMQWIDVCQLVQHFFERTTPLYQQKHTGNRVKQWLNYLRRQYPEAQTLFDTIKRYRTQEDIHHAIEQSLMAADYAQPA